MTMRRNQPLQQRMIRAARLDPNLYEEVERDTSATGQAAIVVLIAGVAAGIAALLTGNILGAFGAVIAALVGWVAWSFITYWVGTKFFATAQTRVTPGEMLRALGFSQSPGVLLVLTFIPILGALIGLAVAIWVLIAGVIAVRQAMDFTTGRAIGTVAVGFLINAVLQILLRAIF